MTSGLRGHRGGEHHVGGTVQRGLGGILQHADHEADGDHLHRNVVGDTEQAAAERYQQQRPARELAPRPRQHAHRATREEHSLRRGQLHSRRQSLERYLEAPVPLALAAVVARGVAARRSPVAATDRVVVPKTRPAAVASCVAVDDSIVDGDIQPLVDALTAAYQTKLLEAEGLS